jgi:hypothetical protein
LDPIAIFLEVVQDNLECHSEIHYLEEVKCSSLWESMIYILIFLGWVEILYFHQINREEVDLGLDQWEEIISVAVTSFD